jgi:hypothetical protein
LDQYQHPSEPKFKVFNQVYLKGVVDGLIAFSVAQNARDRFFCIPPKMAITVEQAEDIMLRYADTAPGDLVDFPDQKVGQCRRSWRRAPLRDRRPTSRP